MVLTDGADNKSTIDVAALERSLRNQAESERTAVRVFAIAYGADASKPVLDRIAAAARGRAYSGDPATIEKVYTQISSFF